MYFRPTEDSYQHLRQFRVYKAWKWTAVICSTIVNDLNLHSCVCSDFWFPPPFRGRNTVRSPQLHRIPVVSSASRVKMLQITTSVTAGLQMFTVKKVAAILCTSQRFFLSQVPNLSNCYNQSIYSLNYPVWTWTTTHKADQKNNAFLNLTRDSNKQLSWLPEARYCYTSHTMDSYGESTSVTKRCATLQDCLSAGCAYINDSGHQVGVTSQVKTALKGWHSYRQHQLKSDFCAPQVCSSCCEGNICNILVPKNESSAVFSSTSPLASAGRRPHLAAPSYVALTLLFLLLTVEVAERATKAW